MYYNILLTGINYGKNGIIMLLIACTVQYYTVVYVYALYMPSLAIGTQSHALIFAFTPCLLQYGTTHGDERGFGGNAPNKLMASAAGTGSEPVSDPCHRHGQKLVQYMPAPTDLTNRDTSGRSHARTPLCQDVYGHGAPTPIRRFLLYCPRLLLTHSLS